jgi:hypothetical protein
MNISVRVRVRVSDPAVLPQWTSSVSYITPAIRDAYTEYKERHHYYRETPHISRGYIVYRPDNDPYLPTYIARIEDIPGAGAIGDDTEITSELHDVLNDTNRTMPIIDLNDIYVFLTDHPPNDPAWISARSYQIWAYRDYVYDRNRMVKKSYMTRDTDPFVYENDSHILANQMVTIDVANVSPNIVFNISRNDNNSVYYERNDTMRRRIRICDSQFARIGYLGYYTRLTMDPGMFVNYPPELPSIPSASSALLSIAHLPDPEEVCDGDRDDQCILCVKYRVNARFSPCEHQVCCGLCYSKMSKNECPVCRAEITRVMNL